MSGKRASVAAGVVGLLAVGGVSAAAANASAAAPSAPHWRTVESVKGQAAGEFNTVVATGKETGWAFEWLESGPPTVAFERIGGTWTKEPFPGRRQEVVQAAAATSPSDVWVATQEFTVSGGGSRVLHFNGHAWSVVRTFTRSIDELAVRASNDVWAFGPAGVLHYNGRTWAQVGGPVVGGSVISDNDVWAFSHSNAYHWNGPGHLWTVTSLVGLLPARLKSGLNDPQVVGILALSHSNVCALGNGHAEDQGGPIALLHYDGHVWRRVAEGGYGDGAGMSPDGHGGLWIPMPGELGETSKMLHYAGGKLTVTALPGNTRVADISRVPGRAEQLAAGAVPVPTSEGATSAAVILQYS